MLLHLVVPRPGCRSAGRGRSRARRSLSWLRSLQPRLVATSRRIDGRQGRTTRRRDGCIVAGWATKEQAVAGNRSAERSNQGDKKRPHACRAPPVTACHTQPRSHLLSRPQRPRTRGRAPRHDSRATCRDAGGPALVTTVKERRPKGASQHLTAALCGKRSRRDVPCGLTARTRSPRGRQWSGARGGARRSWQTPNPAQQRRLRRAVPPPPAHPLPPARQTTFLKHRCCVERVLGGHPACRSQFHRR